MENNKRERTQEYTPEIAKEICDEIASNPCGIGILCERNPSWPSKKRIFQWLRDNETFRDDYHKAIQDRIAPLVEDLLDEANKPSSSLAEAQDKRLKNDTVKFLAMKLAPKIYGDVVYWKMASMEERLDKLLEIAHKK